MPTASVRVRPGILPATTIVAPNSPSARVNPSSAPARMLREASGSVTVVKTRQGRAPSVSDHLLVTLRHLLKPGTRGANEQGHPHDRHRQDDSSRREHDLNSERSKQPPYRP